MCVHGLGENKARDFLDIGQGSHMSINFEYETFLCVLSTTDQEWLYLLLVRQEQTAHVVHQLTRIMTNVSTAHSRSIIPDSHMAFTRFEK